jgi:hypothetical protein
MDAKYLYRRVPRRNSIADAGECQGGRIQSHIQLMPSPEIAAKVYIVVVSRKWRRGRKTADPVNSQSSKSACKDD